MRNNSDPEKAAERERRREERRARRVENPTKGDGQVWVTGRYGTRFHTRWCDSLNSSWLNGSDAPNAVDLPVVQGRMEHCALCASMEYWEGRPSPFLTANASPGDPVAIRAEPVRGRDLKPGDLFSTAGPYYWDRFNDFSSVGERVYLRTNAPADDFPDADALVYRITVVPKE